MLYKNGYIFENQKSIHTILFLIADQFLAYHYFIFMLKSCWSNNGLGMTNTMIESMS